MEQLNTGIKEISSQLESSSQQSEEIGNWQQV